MIVAVVSSPIKRRTTKLLHRKAGTVRDIEAERSLLIETEMWFIRLARNVACAVLPSWLTVCLTFKLPLHRHSFGRSHLQLEQCSLWLSAKRQYESHACQSANCSKSTKYVCEHIAILAQTSRFHNRCRMSYWYAQAAFTTPVFYHYWSILLAFSLSLKA